MRTSKLSAFAMGVCAGILIGAGVMAIALIGCPALPKAPAYRAPTPEPEPTPVKPPEPFAGYDDMPIQQIRESLRALSLSGCEAVRAYEEATLKRRGILNVLTALEEERAHGNA